MYSFVCSPAYVLIVGRLEPLKAPDIFVLDIPLVLRELRTKFLIVRSGSMKDCFRRLADKLVVSTHVDFRENLSYDDLARTVSRASAVVTPGNAVYTLLGAGAACKPFATVRSSWNEGALGDAALYVEPNDVSGIADGIVKILMDIGFAGNLGQRACDFVERNRDSRVI
jgi:glycosyltransferase involved in cell wall biosynthesis